MLVTGLIEVPEIKLLSSSSTGLSGDKTPAGWGTASKYKADYTDFNLARSPFVAEGSPVRKR